MPEPELPLEYSQGLSGSYLQLMNPLQVKSLRCEAFPVKYHFH
jgi:hypothetical protein